MHALKWQDGPAKVALKCGATIDLPAEYKYLDVPQAKKLREAFGNKHTDETQGIIGPANPNDQWLAYLDYEESGYIKDDEKIDADALLKGLKEAQDEANGERARDGHPALHLEGWSETPRYEAATHHLVWGLRVRTDGYSGESINFNTRILGRRGYISLNLVADSEELNRFKPDAEKLLHATAFDPGARYADYTPSTD